MVAIGRRGVQWIRECTFVLIFGLRNNLISLQNPRLNVYVGTVNMK